MRSDSQDGGVRADGLSTPCLNEESDTDNLGSVDEPQITTLVLRLTVGGWFLGNNPSMKSWQLLLFPSRSCTSSRQVELASVQECSVRFEQGGRGPSQHRHIVPFGSSTTDLTISFWKPTLIASDLLSGAKNATKKRGTTQTH